MEQENNLNWLIKLTHEGTVTLAQRGSRKELKWKNSTAAWSQLVNRLSRTHRTLESYREYKAMSKKERDNIKDIGGFVGGSLKDGRRKAENVISRTLVSLDLEEN
jgi:putative DNA primase/helicase